MASCTIGVFTRMITRACTADRTEPATLGVPPSGDEWAHETAIHSP
nr:hypothetical protein JVH1_1034 [Rhodococcus sp. JVH1]